MRKFWENRWDCTIRIVRRILTRMFWSISSFINVHWGKIVELRNGSVMGRSIIQRKRKRVGVEISDKLKVLSHGIALSVILTYVNHALKLILTQKKRFLNYLLQRRCFIISVHFNLEKMENKNSSLASSLKCVMDLAAYN